MPTVVSLLRVEIEGDPSSALSALQRTDQAIQKTADKSQMQAAVFSRAGFLIADIGRGFEQAGRRGLDFFKSSLDAAVTYEKTAALTQTQAQRVGGALKEVGEIGKRVAKEIPAAFAQMQPALYDIFSTTNLEVKDAEKALRLFSKAAVAGQVDIRTASRASIDMMNAFGKDAGDLNKILDLQFKIVQTGKGEYSEVAANIGRASASALRAGQSMEEFGGIVSFISRFLPSMGNTVASAGRAMDAFSNPKVVGRLEKMGVAVRGLGGEFRPISDVMTDLGRKMDGLTKPQRAEALQELFKGAGGTIQARRFFDIAIEEFGSLNNMVDEVTNNTGEMDKAFRTMADTNAVKLQHFRNQWDLLRTSIGEKLLPALAPALEILNKLITAFSNLSPGMQEAIVKTLLIGSALLFATGKILTLIGAVFRFKAAILLVGELGTMAKASGTAVGLFGKIAANGFLATLGPIFLVVAAIAAIGVAVYMLIKHWDVIKAYYKETWDYIKSLFVKAKEGVIKAWDSVTGYFSGLWDDLVKGIKDKINTIKRFFIDVRNVFLAFWEILTAPADRVEMAFEILGQTFGGVFSKIGGVIATIREKFNAFLTFMKELPKKINDFFNALPGMIAYALGFVIGRFIKWGIDIWNWASEAIPNLVEAISTFIATLPERLWGYLVLAWQKFVDWGTEVLITVVGTAARVTAAILDWLVAMPGTVWNWLTQVWQKFVDWGTEVLITVVGTMARVAASILDWLVSLPGRVWSWLSQIPGKFVDAFNKSRDATVAGGEQVVKAFGDMVGKIWNWIKDLPTRLWAKAKEIGRKFVEGLRDGLGIASPSLPEQYFAAIAQSAMGSSQAVSRAIGSMNASISRGVVPSFTPSVAVPVISGASGGSVGPISDGGRKVTIENLNVTPLDPTTIAADISKEISWEMEKMG